MICVVAVLATSTALPPNVPVDSTFELRLLADLADVEIEFGLVVNHANTIARNPEFSPPPGDYEKGTMILAMFRSLETPGEYEVYLTNSSGNIPLMESERDMSAQDGPGMCLFRWITSDFRKYRGGECTLWISSDGLGDVKTITRDDDSKKYYMIVWGHASAAAVLYCSV